MTLAAKSSGVVDWTIEAGSKLARDGWLPVVVTAFAGSVIHDQLTFVLLGEADLEQTLAQAVRPVALPIGETKRWTPNGSNPGTLVMDSTPMQPGGFGSCKGRGVIGGLIPCSCFLTSVHLEGASGLILRAGAQPGHRSVCWSGKETRMPMWCT